MKYQKGFAPLIIIILVVVGILSAGGGYAWYKSTPTQLTQEVSQDVVSSITPEGTPSVVQSVQEKVVEHTSQAVLNSLDEKRQKADNQKIQNYLSSFKASAETYFDGQVPSGYGTSVTGAAGCSTQGSMFTSNVYSGNTNYKPLLDPSDYPSGTKFVCNVSADGKTYAVQASLVGGGYWCVDSKRASKSESSPLGNSSVCQ